MEYAPAEILEIGPASSLIQNEGHKGTGKVIDGWGIESDGDYEIDE
jgi:hypothetical protein